MKYIFFFLLLFASQSFAQTSTDQQLANLYFTNGEYDKAIPYYEKIITKTSQKFEVLRLVESYEKTSNTKEAEKLLKKQRNYFPEDLEYAILLGDFFERNQKEKEASKLYEDLIDKAKEFGFKSVELYNAFTLKGKTNWGLKALEAARKKHKKNYPLNMEFADAYALLGRQDEMIQEYFELLDDKPNYAGQIQTALSDQIDVENDASGIAAKLKENLLVKIQKKPDEFVYSEMLIWLFIQKKEFKSAFVQAQALDKRQDGKGAGLMSLAETCVQNNEFPVARQSYKAVVDLGSDQPNYYRAYTNLLNVRYREITFQKKYTQQDISDAIVEYETAITAFGKNRNAIPLIKELAQIKIYYNNQSEEAVTLLESALLTPGISTQEKAELKMILADALVISDDIWQASIYYMQIDKEYKFEDIGSLAKFKNARIFYYDGDFAFAQSQLDVLKQSTSKFIANDAMKLSILITDNLGLDSNEVAMNQFSHADLLLEQHQYTEAFKLYDSIQQAAPASGLLDEILLRKAQAMQQQGNWLEAVSYLENIVKYHMFDILSDDAIFQLGDIYENHLNDKEKAADYYKKLLFECKGSLLNVEARKRYRILRGDKGIEEESN